MFPSILQPEALRSDDGRESVSVTLMMAAMACSLLAPPVGAAVQRWLSLLQKGSLLGPGRPWIRLFSASADCVVVLRRLLMRLTMAPDFAADCREALTSTDLTARWSDLALVWLRASPRMHPSSRYCNTTSYLMEPCVPSILDRKSVV